MQECDDSPDLCVSTKEDKKKKKKKQKVPVLNKPLTSVSAPTCFAKQSDVDF